MSLYVINRSVKYYINISILSEIFRYHFNDYLGGIVFLSYVNIILSFSKYKQANDLKSVLIYATICSIAWEGIIPIFSSKSTGDVLDVLAYFAGALTYYFIVKKLLQPES